jgi:hypothetical protein
MSKNLLMLVSLFILTLALSAVAQQREDEKIRKIIEEVLGPKRTAQAQPIPAKRKFNHKIKIETKYDKFSDSTDVQMMHTQIYNAHGSRAQKIYLTAVFNYPGYTPSKPDYVALAFNSTSSEWKYLRERDLTIIADGKHAGPVTTLLLNTRIERGGSVSETVSVNIATDVFLFMVNAFYVEMQLGDAEFTLKPEQLEALRDFASRMQP